MNDHTPKRVLGIFFFALNTSSSKLRQRRMLLLWKRKQLIIIRRAEEFSQSAAKFGHKDRKIDRGDLKFLTAFLQDGATTNSSHSGLFGIEIAKIKLLQKERWISVFTERFASFFPRKLIFSSRSLKRGGSIIHWEIGGHYYPQLMIGRREAAAKNAVIGSKM